MVEWGMWKSEGCSIPHEGTKGCRASDVVVKNLGYSRKDRICRGGSCQVGGWR